MEALIPIFVVMTVFAYLGWRRYLAHQERMTALRQGIDPATLGLEEKKSTQEAGKPEAGKAPKDHRLGSMILIAVGIAFMVAVFFSVGARRGVERATAAAVWGIIPIAIGAVRYAYEASRKEGEEPDSHRRSALVLMAVGASYVVCVSLSTGMIKGAERAMAVGVWGLIPFAIGVAMYVYSGMMQKERAEGLRRGEEGR